MDWNSEIETAATRIAGHVQQTPSFLTQAFGLGFPVEMKLEHMQHTGSFKVRGAFNTLLSRPAPKAGVVAASGGNHGAAVAYAARSLNVPAHIFVPEIAGPSKIALVERTGADLSVVPGTYAEALSAAQQHEAATGAMQIHAYDATPTIAGQGSCFLEWDRQGLMADTVLVAVGGGGLIAGALAWFGQSRKVVAVEPETSCALHAALDSGAPVDVEVSGIAANALGARRIGTMCFELAQGMDSVLVSDDDIAKAQRALWQEKRQLVEPAGAASLAALMSGAYVPEPGERVAILVCGGNVARDPFAT
ncbi:MAG: threonine/serine dehydratase [Pseudomonadota bacterium]